MNKDKLVNAGIDFEDGIERFGQNEELFCKYLNKFPNDKNFHQLVNALQQKDYKNSYIYAHTLKGTSGNLSMKILYKKISELVELLRDKKDDIEIPNIYLQNVELEYNKIVESIVNN